MDSAYLELQRRLNKLKLEEAKEEMRDEISKLEKRYGNQEPLDVLGKQMSDAGIKVTNAKRG